MNPDEVQTSLENMADQLAHGVIGTVPEELLAIADWVAREFVEVEVAEEE